MPPAGEMVLPGGWEERQLVEAARVEEKPTVYYAAGMAKLTLIDGGHDQGAERLFRALLDDPVALDQEAYEDLVERFRDRLSIDDILSLTARRLRDRDRSLERNLVLAIAEGRLDEANRLHGILKRQRRLGLSIAGRAPASPPRSS